MKKFAVNGAVAAAIGLLIAIAGPASAANHAWSPIQPTGGLARDFFEVGDDLWMYALGAVLKTTDAGATWTVQPQVPDGQALSVSPHDSNVIYRAGSSKIHRSVDGGVTWTTTDLPTTAVFGDVVVDIAFHQTDPMTAFAAVNSVGIYSTSDGGATWSLLSTQPATKSFNAFASDPHNAGVLYLSVEAEGMYKSVDSGASWTAINTGSPLTWIGIIAFDPAVANKIFIGSMLSQEIYRTVDGGASWTAVTSGLPAAGGGLTPSAIEPGDDAGEFYATFDGSAAPGFGIGERAFKSVDGGDNWTALTPPVAARGPQTTAIYADPATPGRLLMGTRIGNFVSVDDGASWQWSNTGFNQTTISDFDFGDAAGEVYVSSRLGGVLYTPDAGATWAHLNDGVVEPDFVAIEVSPHDPEHVIASNLSGPFVSNDGGVSWTSIDKPSMELQALAFNPVDAATAYAVGDGGTTFLRTLDSGATWTEFPTGATNVFSDTPTRVVASALTAGLVFKNHFDGVYKSIDGGATWALANGNLPAATATTVALGPDDTVYAAFGGTVMGTYRSVDAGQTWERIWAGLPFGDGSMRVLAFDPRDPQRMLAASHSVHGSIDGGTTWVPLNDGLDIASERVSALAFDPVVEGRYFLASGTQSTQSVLKIYTGGIAVDLIGSATRTPTAALIGDTISVEFSVSNLAGYTATGATFELSVPDEFTLTSWTFADATCVQDGLTLACMLPAIAVDAVLSGTATLTSAASGTGAVAITVGAAEPDVAPANNAATMSVTATEPTTTPPPTGGGGDTDSGGGGGSFGWLWSLTLLLPVPTRIARRIG